MQVQFQVVGIFYNVMLDVSDTNPTVKSLMDAAVATPNPAGSLNGGIAFNYGTHVDAPGAPPTMSDMSVTYDAPFQSRVLGNHYPAGTYALKESFDPTTASPQYTVWQYYMFDANGTYVYPSSVSEPFVTQSLNGIARVSWRLVTILGGPSTPLGATEYLSKRDPRMRAMGVA